MKVQTPRSELRRTQLTLVGVNLLIIVVLTSVSPYFLSARNLTSVLNRMGELALLSVAETLVFISGGFDLSIGSAMALSAITTGSLYALGVPFYLCLLAGLLTGIVVGYINAALVVKLRLQDFIVTLATMNAVRSIVYGIQRGRTLTDFPDWLLAIGDMSVLGIPLTFILVLLVAAAFGVFLRLTPLGRDFFAVGGNTAAAYMSGVYVRRIKYTSYMLSGFLSAVAGILFVVRIGAATANAGLHAPLQVVTAVLIGGTLVTGGKGSVLGSLLGISAMFLLVNGFSILGLNPFWQQIVLGCILIYVVGRRGVRDIAVSVAAAIKRIAGRGGNEHERTIT